MPKRLGHVSLPNISFKDGVLSIPGYVFEQAYLWNDVGSMTILAEGSNLKDGSNVLAKIAPAHSDGSLCLEREAHVLGRLTTSAESGATLRLLEYLVIPPETGDCVVLVMGHPGVNQLGRYLSPPSSNDLLLCEQNHKSFSHTRIPSLSPGEIGETGASDDNSTMLMDLATFLEFAIQATHCLEVLHKLGFIHREVRINAFHLNAHSGSARLVHFGNRAVSLEQLGGPSPFVLRADGQEGLEKESVRLAMCHLAPEQTGILDITTEDHRTDLYALGIVFWMTLVGGGALPFEAGPLELLHCIVQNRPRSVHEVRRDVPVVVSNILDKLLSKLPDSRYNSAIGLQADLIECQKRLNATVGSLSNHSTELIPYFEVGLNDKFTEFTIPAALFGREKEMELIRSVIRQASANHSHLLTGTKGSLSISISPTSTAQGATAVTVPDDGSESATSRSDASQPHMSTSNVEDSPKPSSVRQLVLSSDGMSQGPHSPTPSTSNPQGGDNYRRVTFQGATKNKITRTHTIVVSGPAGVGKSALVSAHQARWRTHGLWGHAKFVENSPPFFGILTCLSSVLRQLMVIPTDINLFVSSLRIRLGPQLRNVPLLYNGAPELKDVLNLYDLSPQPLQELLPAEELRVRFQLLVEAVFGVLAEIRLLALFMDDIQFADESSLDLISALANAKGRMLLLVSLRSEIPSSQPRVSNIFQSRSRTTWINLEPLNHNAVLSLVTKTLHRAKDECIPLSRLCHRVSQGNPFSVRNILTSFRRQNHIYFDFSSNSWKFNMDAIERSISHHKEILDPNNMSYLVQHLRELPEEARNFIAWGSLLGSTFKVTEVVSVIDWADSASEESDMEDGWDPKAGLKSKGSIKGLHVAITEGWIIHRARDKCAFTHDRYRQAAVSYRESLSPAVRDKMTLRIVLMLARDSSTDVLRIAEYCKRCPQLLQEHPRREEFLGYVLEAADSASARGAHETALEFFLTAKILSGEDAWTTSHSRTFDMFLRTAELLSWSGNTSLSSDNLAEMYRHARRPEERAQLLRLRSQNHFLLKDFGASLDDMLSALRELGITIDSKVSRRDADALFDIVKNQILHRGFDSILAIPKSTDTRAMLAVQLLNDAATAAYWSTGEGWADVIGLTTIQESLRCGMCPGSALGFLWILSASAERRELYRFSIELGKLGLRIAEMHGTTAVQAKVQLLYIAMVASYENVHIQSQIHRLDIALQLAHSAGDRIYAGFSILHRMTFKLYVCEHLSELIPQTEEAVRDLYASLPQNHLPILLQGLVPYLRAIAGHTISTCAANVYDSATFIDSEHMEFIRSKTANIRDHVMNWYNSLKTAALFCLGWGKEAAELGFEVYETRLIHPNHRHARYGLFFHSLALIQSLRERSNGMSEEMRVRYMGQIELNQQFLRRWLSPGPINNATWVAIVDAEYAALCNSPGAFKLYDTAVTLAINSDWLLEEGLALYLQGSHFVLNGIESLGSELQRRGIARQAQWGAMGIVKSLSMRSKHTETRILKRNIFTAEVAVQTDNVFPSLSAPPASLDDDTMKLDEEDEYASLRAEDLVSVLRWNQSIASDMNLSSALQRMTEIAGDISSAQYCSVALRTEDGEFSVSSSLISGAPCQIFENPRPIRAITDPLRRLAMHHCLTMKARIFLPDATQDSRYSSEAAMSSDRSVICIPIVANRSHLQGILYTGGKYAFRPNDVTLLTLLAQQASVSIANALLFRSVQQATKANLKMISSQQAALEDARKSREDALKATKIKSNFLASMSHELRTPFSSFYGLLDLLGGTSLNPGQHEIVQTAKQSCELLLKIIDSILDYSKLEAEALRIEVNPFPVEDVIADCMELLLPMAVKKLDMSFDVEAGVPRWVVADYARIRQVLMNLLGNGLKFTSGGFVRAICAVDSSAKSEEGEVLLKFTIQDSGIGLSQSEIESLFVPFQQADNSSTRRFGGTGLGLSISRELIKLMKGQIGVQSELGVGSSFWFTIPVKIHESVESRKAIAALEQLKRQLTHTRLLIASSSETTLALLRTMLVGLNVTSARSIESANEILVQSGSQSLPFDFAIIDHQSESQVDRLAQLLQNWPCFSECKVVHLYTPTSTSLSKDPSWGGASPRIIRSHKPPRTFRLLQLLASLKGIPGDKVLTKQSDVSQAMADLSAVKRTLYGNVLIAEDNPVAQQLLIKQLERYQLNVTATSNGNEAVSEWEVHEPGFFSVALFDHRMQSRAIEPKVTLTSHILDMPVCDGVEACKRIRLLENRRKVDQALPIVALSADCQPSVQQLCLSAGMTHFLSKPLKRADLTALLSMFGDAPTMS